MKNNRNTYNLYFLFSIPPKGRDFAMRHIFLLCSIFYLLSSCTTDLTIDLPDSEPQFVVEGHIETGQPPYVLLTKSSGFYSTFFLDSISSYFVHGAVVRVSDGTDTVTLQELFIDTGDVTVAAYVSFAMIGQEGKTYSLFIEAEGQTISSVTTIPTSYPLDSIWWEPAEGEDADTLVKLLCRYNDPPEMGQYVRYFTKRNDEPYYPGLNSVFEDAVINGEQFDFILDRGVNRSDSAVFDDYGLFRRGDTISVRWCNIDFPHFDFWRTLEFELGGQGSPFATPVIIQGNINGGLGIWGGYAPSYNSLIVPE